MWFEFIEEFKKKLSEETEAKVFIGIDQPKDVRDYPFISLIPAEFTEDEDKKLMLLGIAFGIREEEKSDDPAPMYERGTNKLLNLMSQIERVLTEIEVKQFEVLEEKETVRNFEVKAPKFLMEMHVMISVPKFPKPMEDF